MPAIAIMHVYVKITKSGVVYCESIPKAFVSKEYSLKKNRETGMESGKM